MKGFIITCILAGGLILSEVALAAPTLTDIKIGDISAFKGEVLIRTQKKWMRLKKTPHPLYATDKVVARRGRAEVVFTDGGRLRLDLDTNISIHQLRENSAKDANQKVALQLVNILVGKVWFDVKIKPKGRALKFITPTMTAAIRGTKGGFAVSSDGSSQYGLSSGKAIMSGQFSPLQNTVPPDFNEPLPPSDPLVDNSPLQQAAVAAVEAAELADKTELAAQAQKGDTAISDIKARAQSSAAATQAAYNRALSDHSTLLEMMTESQRFNNSNESLREQIEASQATLEQLRGLVTQTHTILQDVAAAETEENLKTELAKLEEIEKQANNLANLTETAVNESFGMMTVDNFAPGAAPESDIPPPSITDGQNKEITYEGDLDTRTDPSPSQ
jgi:hypothetical protein